MKSQLLLRLKKELLTRESNPLEVGLNTPGREPLVVSIIRFRETAAIALWMNNVVVKNNKILSGVGLGMSLLLSGLDPEADEQAIRYSVRDRMVPDFRDFIEAAQTEARPIMLTYCQKFEVSIDPFFRGAVEALGEAYFDQFGN